MKSTRFTTAALGADGQLSPADYLFFALDSLVIARGAKTWRTSVCGIHKTAKEWWIQLSLSGKPEYLLTLPLPLGGNPVDAIDAIGSSLELADLAGAAVPSPLQIVN
jgi:hypothetical protein